MDVHADVIARKQEWIEQRRREGVDGVFRATALALPMPPSLRDALLVPRGERTIVARLCGRTFVDRGGDRKQLGALIDRLTEAGASAFLVSVGEGDDGFGFEDVLCAAQTTHLPIICADLILDPLQITLARAHGAAAVMLSHGLVDDARMRALRRAASDMSLDVVVDVVRVSQLDASAKTGRGGASSAGDACIWCADFFEGNGENTGRLRERFSAVLPEFSLGLIPLPSTATVEDVETWSQHSHGALVVDVSFPDVDAVVSKVSQMVSAL